MIRGHDYSVYSDTPISRIKVYGLLGVVAVVIVSVIREMALLYLITPGGPMPIWVFYIGAATPLVVFGLLVLLFDRFAWRWRVCKPIYILAGDTPPPYIHGEYTGTVTSRDKANNSQKTLPAKVSIIQRWQKLLVTFAFCDSHGYRQAGSNSDMAFIQQGMDGKPTLQYSYSYQGTEPNPDGSVQTVTIHGTAILDFDRDGRKWTISGRYYSDDLGSGRVSLEQST